MSPEEEPSRSGMETQLAVLRLKVDQLLDLYKARGEDHESRLRRLEERQGNYVTRGAVITLIVTVCTVVTAGVNIISSIAMR